MPAGSAGSRASPPWRASLPRAGAGSSPRTFRPIAASRSESPPSFWSPPLCPSSNVKGRHIISLPVPRPVSSSNPWIPPGTLAVDRTRRPLARLAVGGPGGDANGAEAAKPIEVLIADSQPIALDAMARVFDQPGFSVIAGCSTCDETIAVLRQHPPDVLIFDFDVPPDGLALVRDINRHHPGTRAVLFTSATSDSRVQDALDLGVRGVVLREMPPEALLQCVRKVHAGEQWLAAGPRRLVERRRQPHDPDRRRRAGLTGRETDIVKLV